MSFNMPRSRRPQKMVTVMVALLAMGLMAGASMAQTTAPSDAGSSDDTTLTEQSIYIPYSQLRKVFEEKGRGVFLPYEEFRKLWRQAREATAQPPEAGPPADALITEATHEAVIARDVVRVTAHLKVELLTKGWKEIPLRLNNSAIVGATIGDRPARIVFDTASGYRLLLEKKSEEPEQIEVDLEYVRAFSKAPGQNRVTFQSPQAPVSKWRIRVPESGVKVDIQPLIAATEMPAETGEGTAEEPTEETVVLAFVGAAPVVSINWTPKAEGATGLEALVSVRTDQRVTIQEGVTRTRTGLTYDISRSSLPQLRISVPADQRIVNVLDANVRQWSVEETDGKQEITVQLFEPARDKQQVTVELERFHGEIDRQEVSVPVIEANDVGRQQGIVVVQVAPGLRAEAGRHTGLLQMDASELPPAVAQTAWTFAYRFSTVPFDLAIQIEKVQPQIAADSLVEVHLQPERLNVRMLTVYNIERAGVFELEMSIPADYEVRQVTGSEAPGAQPVQVDTYDRRGDDKTRLLINLSRKAIGKVALTVHLHRKLDEPDLLNPSGQSVDIQFAVPRVAGDAMTRATGRLIIHAPESLRVNPTDAEGLRGISFAEAVENMGVAVEKRFHDARAVLAFAYAEEAVRLTVAVERRKPQVTVRQLMVARIDSGVVKYEATFYYEIRYSGVKSLRIDIPAAVASEVRNHTAGVRDRVIDPPPEDLAEGYVGWNLTGETEFFGNSIVRLEWEQKLGKLEVGKSVELAIPCLRPAGVDRAWGQIVLTKAETMDVRETGEPAGVRPIDPQHDLMQGASIPTAARAFEFHADWQLNINITRYKLEEVKRTSIERAVIQMVATRSKQVSVQALYQMRSARQRLAVVLPAGVVFDSEPLRINGRTVPLERGEKDDFFVPLVGLDPEKPFLLELRYTCNDAGLRLVPPAFPSEPAVQKVYLCAYVPQEWSYLGSMGPWTDEIRWRWCPIVDRRPSPRRTGDWLVNNWVREGVEAAGGPAGTFQTDGQLYLFSSLRPAPPPDGSLRLVMLDRDWFNALLLAIALIPGVLLLRGRASVRWIAAGIFIVALIAIGIFLPTLSRQVICDRLVAAVMVVLILWVVHYAVFVRPTDPNLIALRTARGEAKLARIQAKATAAAAKKQKQTNAETSGRSSKPSKGQPDDMSASSGNSGEGGSSDD